MLFRSLPVQGLISPDTYFLESTPYITVTAPGDSTRGITATAYQYLDNSLYFQAGRGFTPNNQVTPDLAAPGVDLLIPLPGGAFGKASGSSLSSAVVAGAAALVQEWAIVRGNIPYASGNTVKFYLIAGNSLCAVGLLTLRMAFLPLLVFEDGRQEVVQAH